jgi:hypothetical protein
MIEMKKENERVARLPEKQLGEEWIRAITEGALDRLEEFCHPKILSRLLLPAGLVTVQTAADLVAEYRAWFGGCTDFKVEASRVGRIGEKFGISYRFLLQDHGDWYRIEQQLYCILNDGHVAQLHLLCSGFQLVRTTD